MKPTNLTDYTALNKRYESLLAERDRLRAMLKEAVSLVEAAYVGPKPTAFCATVRAVLSETKA